ncbi:MAG: hypothetical protein ABFD83_05330 [Armatimonadota bacterium]
MFKKSPVFSLAITLIAYLALWLLVPKATFLPAIINHLVKAASHASGIGAAGIRIIGMLIIALPTAMFMAIQIGIIYQSAKLKMGFIHSLAAFALSLGCAYGLINLIVRQSGAVKIVHRALTLREKLFVVGNYVTPLSMIYFICIMFAAISLGYMVSLRIKDKNLLLPVVMFAAYIDFWTVTRGPVSQVMKNAPEVVGAVSTPIPHAGTGTFMPATMIGPGDFIFMAIVFAVVHRFAMRPSRNYWFVFGAMTLGMLAVLFGLLHALPALMVLAVAVVTANWRAFKLSREEKISTAVVGLLLLASLPIVWSLFKPQPVKKHKPKTAVACLMTSYAPSRTELPGFTYDQPSWRSLAMSGQQPLHITPI